MAFRELEVDEPAPILSIGSIFGGPESNAWRPLIEELRDAAMRLRSGLESPLKVNVVFLVPGSITGPDFVGVRTGSWSAEHSTLMIQVALPPAVPENGRECLREASVAAVDEAERWSSRRGFDTAALHELVRRL